MLIRFFGFVLGYVVHIGLVFVGFGFGLHFAPDLEKQPTLVGFGLLALVVLIGLPPVLFSVISSRPSNAQKRLQSTGQLANAQILEVRDTGLSYGNPDLSFVVRLSFRVQPQLLPGFEATLETQVSRVGVPQAGQSVMVRFDPNDLRKVVLSES